MVIKLALGRSNGTVVSSSGDTTITQIVRTATVRVDGKREVVRLASLRNLKSVNVAYYWIDAMNELFATEVGWFMTVRPGAYPALATLRKIEIQLRDADAETLNKRLLQTTASVRAIKNADFAFLFSTFHQDSLYVPTMRAYSAVATAVAPNIDVDGKPMTDLITFLEEHNTVIDGTFAVWVQRAGTGIAQAVGAGVSADVAKSDANYMRLLQRLYEARVTFVPGTDAYGSTSFDSELELYEKAGIPAPTVLQIATIIPARVMKEDKDYGSIAVGKVADMFIVNGRPAERIRDVRNVEQVFRAGRLHNAAGIKAALGRASSNQ